jgi:lactoylglutathione lyase
MRIFTLVILAAIVVSPFKKSMAQSNAQPSAVLNHIAVYVKDLKTSTDFYQTVFNLQITPEPFHDGKHTWFALKPGGNLHLIQGAKGDLKYDKNEHLCFSVPSVATFIEKLNAKNIKFENWAGAAQQVTLRVDGVKQVYFQDPDGHWLEVNDAKK